MAKGMSSGYVPISAVALSDEIATTISDADTEMAHGFTYSGHPMCCAVSIRNIELMEEWDLVGERGRQTAAHFQHRLASLQDHPLVGQTRGIGMLGAIELVADKSTQARFEPEGHAGMTCRNHCFETGVVMRAVGDTMFLSPPLVITATEIDEMFELIRKSLDLTYQSLSA